MNPDPNGCYKQDEFVHCNGEHIPVGKYLKFGQLPAV